MNIYKNKITMRIAIICLCNAFKSFLTSCIPTKIKKLIYKKTNNFMQHLHLQMEWNS